MCTCSGGLKLSYSLYLCSDLKKKDIKGGEFPVLVAALPGAGVFTCLLVWKQMDGPVLSKKLSKALFALLRWLQRLTKVQENWLKSTETCVFKPSA